MKISDFFDNLNVYFKEDVDSVDDVEDLDESAQVYAYAYKNDKGEVIELRIFNPEYREMLSIDRNGNVEQTSLEDV